MVVRRSHVFRREGGPIDAKASLRTSAARFFVSIHVSFDSMIQSAIQHSYSDAARPLGSSVFANTWRAPSSDADVGTPRTESQRVRTRAGNRRDVVAR
jgi:hypothetical protein